MRRKAFTHGQMAELRDIAYNNNVKMKGARLWRFLDSFSFFVLTIMIALAIRTFVLQPIRVDGKSMYPNLDHGEIMFVEKLSYWNEEPQRGDVIICYYPGYTKSCVKRIIALPGETVSIINGETWINGAKLDESAYWNDVMIEDYPGTTVGPNEVFVMGDNRNTSKDSRNNTVGCISKGRIVGRSRAVIWPLSSFKILKRVQY